jgi:urease accessory protein
MAGPVGGDTIGLVVVVEDSAVLSIRSTAASLVMPGPHGEASRWSAQVSVGHDAALRWQPRPTVLVGGSDHRTRLRFDMASHASLWWREEIVLGRHGEAGGSLQQRVDLAVGGRPVHRNEIQLGPRWSGASSPATFGAFRCHGTILVVGPVAAVLRSGVATCVAVHRPHDAVALVSAVGATVTEVRDLLDSVCSNSAISSLR